MHANERKRVALAQRRTSQAVLSLPNLIGGTEAV